MRLSELKTGEKGVVVKVTGQGSFRKRILEMGFVKGHTVTVVRNAPLGTRRSLILSSMRSLGLRSLSTATTRT